MKRCLDCNEPIAIAERRLDGRPLRWVCKFCGSHYIVAMEALEKVPMVATIAFDQPGVEIQTREEP